MAVKITSIEKNSIATEHGIKKGETLISINGNEIVDILDFRFYETESPIILQVQNNLGQVREIAIKKPRYASLGLEFDTYLMDAETPCKNKCVFCFIDQLPKGMRKTLYFKDDDHRLSFLFGNYITLTNLEDKDIDRIIKMHISPVNVSVHTMNPELRCKMMNNRFAGEKLKYLKKLSDGGIKLNCQLVLCPGENDGDELVRSLNELSSLENMQSLACVPVGLTRYREGLYPLKAYDEKTAGAVIDIIEKFGDINLEKTGERKFYPSDEFYILAKRELPNYDFYEDFPQIENGVGMFRSLQEEVLFELEQGEDKVKNRHVTIITGEAIYPLLKKLLYNITEKWDNINIEIIPVKNHFFGGKIDVTGLITGSDIVSALQNRELYDEVLIPNVCLKADEDIFLDDMSIDVLGEKLKCPIKKVGALGDELVNAILGKEL
ncbi:MAG: DUF512 domain-containing protein [Clostridia bacterium]